MASANTDTVAQPLDGVRLAVLTNRLQGIVRKMTNTLFRTARSGVINSAKDFSCCLLTPAGDLLVAAESLPIHVMAGPDLVARYMAAMHPTLRAGDAFLHNDPYNGNSHPADHSLLAPVIDADGVHRFTVYVKAHVADCGNSQPSTLMMGARDVYEEGALIFPCVKAQEDYQHCDDLLRMCMRRIRVPKMWWGDYLGMLGALRIGEREILALGEEISWETLEVYTDTWFDYSESRMTAAIRALDSGSATVRNLHDPVPGAPEGVLVESSVRIDREAGTIGVDLTRSADCVPSGVNLTEATARTAAMVGVFNSIDHTVPKNAGSFRRLDISLRENCVAGIPRHPQSCSTATTGVADRVANATQAAIADLIEGAGMAEAGSFGPMSVAVVSGKDPRRDGEPFVNMLFFITGGAAAPTADGWLTICHTGNGGMMLRDSVEIDEFLYPIRVVTNRIVEDTEGAGRFRGTASNLVEFGPVGTAMDVVWSADGSVYPASGVRGGAPGAPHRSFRRDSTGRLEELPNFGRVTLEPAETVVSYSASGGGYGPPWERSPERVLHDVSEGWLSITRAREVYGVVIGADGRFDPAGTTEARALLAGAETVQRGAADDDAP
jgi:N-methylhydantoinase B